MDSESLSWAEKVDVYTKAVYSNFKKQLDSKDIAPDERAAAMIALVTILMDGAELLIGEGRQDDKMSMGFLAGYVMGRVH